VLFFTSKCTKNAFGCPRLLVKGIGREEVYGGRKKRVEGRQGKGGEGTGREEGKGREGPRKNLWPPLRPRLWHLGAATSYK